MNTHKLSRSKKNTASKASNKPSKAQSSSKSLFASLKSIANQAKHDAALRRLGMLLLVLASFFVSALWIQSYGQITQGGMSPESFKFSLALLFLMPLWVLWFVFFPKLTHNPRFQINAFMLFFALFIAFNALSIVWSLSSTLAQIETFRLTLAALVLMLAVHLIKDMRAVHMVLGSFLLLASALSLIGILQWLGAAFPEDSFIKKTPLLFDSIRWVETTIPQAVSPASTFGNRNMAMNLLILFVPLLALIAIQAQKTSIKIAGYAAFYLVVQYAWMSEHRSSIIGLMIQLGLALVFFALYRPQPWKRSLKHMGIIAAIVLFSFALANSVMGYYGQGKNIYGLAGRFSEIFTPRAIRSFVKAEELIGEPDEYDQGYDSLGARYIIWDTTLFHMVPKHPFLGVGAGNWTLYYPYYNAQSDRLSVTMDASSRQARILYEKAHNDYIQILAEVGIVGTALLFLAFLMASFWIFLVLRRSTNTTHKLWTLGIVLSIAGLISPMGTSFPLRSTPVWMVLMMFVGIVYFFMQAALLQTSNQKTSAEKANPSSDSLDEAPSKNPPQGTKYAMLSSMPWRVWSIKISWPVRIVLAIAVLLLGAWMFTNTHRWNETQSLRNLGVMHLGQKRAATGGQFLAAAIALNPDFSFDSGYTLANIYRSQERYEEAEAVYQQALSSVMPWHPYARVHYAQMLINQKRWNKAVSLLKQNIYEMPLQSMSYFMLGNVYYLFHREESTPQKGAYLLELAIQYYEKALSMPTLYARQKDVLKLVEEYRAQRSKPKDFLTQDAQRYTPVLLIEGTRVKQNIPSNDDAPSDAPEDG